MFLLCSRSVSNAASLPAGFTETLIASGMTSPTAMAVAPDGRVFVCEQGGRLRVIKNSALLSTPFVTLSVDPSGERGLLGVAFDPDFTTNQYVYVYYTTSSSPIHNRVSRYTANGDVAVAGSGVTILDLDNLSSATNHNGGAMHFGSDGKLYIAVGDNATGSNAQTLSNLLGKILRINSDGTIPTDNPFYTTATGKNRAIWAHGLRNPFTFAVQPGTGDIFINDVGQSTWEEVNEGIRGANYGWPATEGATTNPAYTTPLYAYNHSNGCAITGGVFYNPSTPQFPSTYIGDYFFADYCSGWIRKYDPVSDSVADFASGIAAPVDLRVISDGSLYYLAIGSGSTTGAVYRVRYTAAQPPSITSHPASQTVQAGGTATFSVSATGSTPLGYQWQRNGTNITGATSASYTLSPVATTDSGVGFRCIVTNSFGTATSNTATLTVLNNSSPTGTISSPTIGTLYTAGSTISYAGTGTDQEDGTLPPSAFTWEVVFHHDTHTHPFLPPTSGSRGGSFVIPTQGETATNVWYRIHLTVRDSSGLTHTSFRDIRPQTVNLQLATNPAGLQVTVDGQPVTTPASISSVIGMQRTLGVISPQTSGGSSYNFTSWSDGGSATRTITTPATATSYTATYTLIPQSTNLLAAYNFNEGSGTTLNDLSGNGNHGTLSGATWTTQGKFAGALAFNGVNAYVSRPDTASLDLGSAGTVEAWVKLDTLGRWHGVVAKGDVNNDALHNYAVEITNGNRIRCILGSGTSFQQLDSTIAVSVGQFMHFACTWDSTTVRLYVNGVQNNSATRTVTPAGNSAPLFIGQFGGNTDRLHGTIDDVRIYSQTLSAAEIQADMNTSPSSGGPAPSPPPPPSGVVMAYNFDEGVGSTVNDLSGLGNGGAVSGATWTTQGKFGGALLFDGVNDWIAINDASSLDLTTALTLEAWVYPTTISNWRQVLAKEQTGAPSVYGLFAATGPNPQPSGKVYLTNGQNERLIGSSSLPVNVWSHLATTYDGTTLRLYVNGVQVASRSVPGSVLTSNNPLRIGGSGVYGEFFQGRIDNVRIYNRALTAAEVLANKDTPVAPQ